MKKRISALLGWAFPGLLIGCVFAGQLVCAAARGNEQVLKSFNYQEGYPNGGLIEDADGVLYGTLGRSDLNGAVFAINPDGSGFRVLHDLGSVANDATNPVGPLMLGVDGALYGTSYPGGANGVGAIFTLRPDGTSYKVLYSFGTVVHDGVLPLGPLVQGADGTLYGTTYSGGSLNMGTIFRLRPDGSGYRLLHDFRSNYDGEYPRSGLILGKDGALYGMTSSGGTNASPEGTVFKVNTDGSGFILLHSFDGSSNNGAAPVGALNQGNDGAIYGTTIGPAAGTFGNVFRLNADGSDYIVLHNNAPFLNQPHGGLVQALDGSLYGLAGFGQTRGLIFKVNPDGTGYAVVHNFESFAGDGFSPDGALLLGTDGALYGITESGGDYGSGTVFRVTTMTNTPPPPFAMSIVQLAGGSFHIGLEGDIGTTYRLFCSTNLSDWTVQGTVSNETGLVQFLDWNAGKSSLRFYRAISMPH